MSNRLGLLVAGSWALLGMFSAHAALPVDAFSRVPDMQSAALSPDGNQVVFIGGVDGKSYVLVHNLVTSSSAGVLQGLIDGYEVQWCRFKNNDRILCGYQGTNFDAGRPYPVTRLVAVNATGGKGEALIQGRQQGGSQFQSRVLHWLPDDPKHVLVQLDEDANVYTEVYKLNVYSGGLDRVVRERAPVHDWIADRSGAIRFGLGADPQGKMVYLARNSADDGWRVLNRFNIYDDSVDSFSPIGFGVLPNLMLVWKSHNGRDAVFEMDIDEKDDLQLMFANPKVDIDDVLMWPSESRVIGFAYETDAPKRHWIDSDAASLQATVDNALPKTFNSVVGSSRDRQRVLILATSDTQPGGYYLLDRKASTLRLLSAVNSKLEGQALAPMRAIEIAAADGLRLPGYLTLPVGSSGKNLPTIVLPHGGPHARDYWGYDPLVQMLASRGYAVVQVNFRGSTGYGVEWFEAGFRQWGKVIHDDITATTRWAVREGIADPKRVCIVGWSFGGYAALIGPIKEPDLYRCSASIAGVSDIRQLHNDGRFFFGGRKSWAHTTGTEDIDAHSPLKLAGSLRVPTLLVHGDADSQVFVDHSEKMAKELRRAGTPVKLVVIEDGNHSLTRPEWRQTLYTELDAFLEKHLAIR